MKKRITKDTRESVGSPDASWSAAPWLLPA